MLKSVIAFTIGASCLSLISMVAPLFRRDGKKWEQETYLQRFCNCFFLPVIFFTIYLLVSQYREANSPSSLEESLNNGEMEYVLVTDLKEIGDADIVYEISKDNGREEVCRIITGICKELKKTDGAIAVYPENEGYIIKRQDTMIGNVVTVEKKYGLYLEFRWKE